MSKVTGYILFGLGVFVALVAFVAGGDGFISSFLIYGILMAGGIAIIFKSERKTEKSKNQSAGNYIPRRNGYILASAIITLFISLTMASTEISQFMDYSQYAIVQTVSGVMALQGILTIVACILFFMGWWKNNAGNVLVASILTCVAALFMPLYLAFYALPIIFGFIGHKKIKSEAAHVAQAKVDIPKVKIEPGDAVGITLDVMDIVANGEQAHEYSIAGVTFHNDDGSDRQEILEEIQSRGFCSNVKFEINEYQDEKSVAVFVDGKQIGHIKKIDLKFFIEHFDALTGIYEVYVGDFEPDDADIRYYCKISATYNKDRL